jgi:hypothetical protein
MRLLRFGPQHGNGRLLSPISPTGAIRRQITYDGRMPKRKEPPLDPKEQFKRFVETAREHGVDEPKNSRPETPPRKIR